MALVFAGVYIDRPLECTESLQSCRIVEFSATFDALDPACSVGMYMYNNCVHIYPCISSVHSCTSNVASTP